MPPSSSETARPVGESPVWTLGNGFNDPEMSDRVNGDYSGPKYADLGIYKDGKNVLALRIDHHSIELDENHGADVTSLYRVFSELTETANRFAQMETAHQQAVNERCALLEQLEACKGALHGAHAALLDCANQFKGHGMLASYDVAKVYANDCRLALRPATQPDKKEK